MRVQPNAEDIREARERWDCSVFEAKRILVGRRLREMLAMDPTNPYPVREVLREIVDDLYPADPDEGSQAAPLCRNQKR